MKKLTTILLSSFMVLSPLTASVAANEPTALQSTSQSLDLSTYTGTTLTGNSYTLSGTTTYPVTINAPGQAVNLVLNGATINSADSTLPALYIEAASSVSVSVTGTNTLSSAVADEADANAALYSTASISLSGTGSLALNAPNAHGINTDGDISTSGLSLTTNTGKDGLHSDGAITVSSGTYSFTASDEGIQAGTALTIQNGTFTIQSVGDCLRAETTLNISGGTFTLNSSENEGIESKDALTISGGTFDINTYDDCLNAANSLTISGGTLRMKSQSNDGIDSNGTLTLSGGDITSVATSGIEGAFDVDNTPFVINGGTIIGVSGGYTAPTQITQNAILVGSISTLNSIQVTSNGTTLFTRDNLNIQGNNSSLFLSFPGLSTGAAVEVLINGTSVGTLTIAAGVNQIGNVNTGPGGFPGGNFPGNPGDGLGPGPVIQNPYSDVTSSDWYYDYAIRAYEMGLITGSNGKFEAAKGLTRADFTLILYRLAGSPEVNGLNPFSDVSNDAYYAKAVVWADEQGVLTGTVPNEVFSPAKDISRQDFVTALARYYQNVAKKTLENEVSLDDYPDLYKVASYAYTPLSWAVGNDIIKGIEVNGTYYLDPVKTTNRAEAAKMIVLFAQLVRGNTFPGFPGDGF